MAWLDRMKKKNKIKVVFWYFVFLFFSWLMGESIIYALFWFKALNHCKNSQRTKFDSNNAKCWWLLSCMELTVTVPDLRSDKRAFDLADEIIFISLEVYTICFPLIWICIEHFMVGQMFSLTRKSKSKVYFTSATTAC